VTADIETAEASGSMSPDDDRSARRVVGAHLAVAVVFFVVGITGGVIAALELAVPDLLGGIEWLSYGRLAPMVTTILMFGWLTVGFLGAIYYVLPRLGAEPLRNTAITYASLLAITVGVAAGVVAIALGQSEGRPYLEMPLYADAFVLIGLVLAATATTNNVAAVRQRMVPTHWYFVAATWWAVLAFVVGNVPALYGFTSSMQTGFFRAGIVGFWFAAAGIGLIYYLIPRITGTDAMRPSSLSALGFWSLAVVWGATAPIMYIYGPGPGWYESLGVAFAIGLFVPVLIIVADFFIAMRGQWSEVVDRGALSFVIAGSFLFLLIPVLTLFQALRTSSALVQFTEWIPAGDALVFLGALSMWLFAFAYRVKGAGAAETRTATWHLRITAFGLVVMLAAMWMAGIVTGFTWAAGVNSAEFTSFGDGWAAVDRVLDQYLVVRATGMAIYALAQLLFLSALVRSYDEVTIPAVEAQPLDLQIAGEPRTPSWRSMRYGAVGMFAVAFFLTLFLPALDPSVKDGTILADRYRVYPAGSPTAVGRSIYIEEGCLYCHTQEVRPIVTDVGLGPVSEAGDYVHEAPALLGVERLGPDLMHVGSRYDNAGVLASRLSDPRASREWSNMPSYDYLSEAELNALTEYLLTLK
jgi:cbb3-type cytochrome oxidase subunit 1